MENTIKKSLSLGLIGAEIGHSLSPAVHEAAFKSVGIAGDYRLYSIMGRNIDKQMDSLIQKMRSGEINGLNVTIPYKKKVIQFLDTLDEVASSIGAVNTIYYKYGKVIGSNTDADGFIDDLENKLGKRLNASNNAKKIAIVLGAGGAAHAVCYILAENGWKILLIVKRAEQAEQLISKLGTVNNIRWFNWDNFFSGKIPITWQEISLIVNATPVGMSPKVDASPWVNNLPFPESACIYDLVYNPVETLLVREARAAGLQAVTGLGMLVRQAALSFEIWTGKKPNPDKMYEAAYKLLTKGTELEK